MNEVARYRMQFGYWLGVLLVAFGVSRSIVEFGHNPRFLKPGWEQEFVNLCSKNHDVCEAVKIVDQHMLWTNKIVVEVTASTGQEVQAYQLMNQHLTNDQRRLVSVALQNGSRLPKATEKH
jgi:hypothetical protein